MANNDQTRQQCLDQNARCLRECETCAAQCCAQGGAEMAQCIVACMDCADACATTMSWLSRQSVRGPRMAELCAQVCDQCAAECERFDMDACQRCAEACRRCAEACRAMAAAPAA
jgi:hypothetical protein